MASLLLNNGDSVNIQITDLTNTSMASIRAALSADTCLVIGFSQEYLMTLRNSTQVCSSFESVVTSNRTITSIQVYSSYVAFIDSPLCFATSLFGSIVKRGFSTCFISSLSLEYINFRLSLAELLPFRNSFFSLFMSTALETFKTRVCFLSDIGCPKYNKERATFSRMRLEDFCVPVTHETGSAVLSKALLKNTSLKFIDVRYVSPELYKTLSVLPGLTVLNLSLSFSCWSITRLLFSILEAIEKCNISRIVATFRADMSEELYYCFLSSIRKSGNVEKLQLVTGSGTIEFPSTFVLSFLCQAIEMERIKCEARISDYYSSGSVTTEEYEKQLQRLKSCIAETRPNFSFK